LKSDYTLPLIISHRIQVLYLIQMEIILFR